LSSLFLIKNELDQTEVIVINDGSRDGTEDIVSGYRDKIGNLNYHYQNNRGPAAARNLGAKNAKGQYLVFVDDDCYFTEGCFQSIKDFYKNNRGYSGLGVKTVNHTKSIFSEFNQRLGDYLIWDSKKPSGSYRYTSSRCYSFSKESFLKVGGHDEGFVWPAAEDRDLCFRIMGNDKLLAYLETKPLLNTDSLVLKDFIKQNFTYGLGLGMLLQKHPEKLSMTASRLKDMISRICRDDNFLKRTALFMIFCMVQICTAVGLISYKINYDYKKRPPSVFLPKHAIFMEMVKNFILGFPFAKSIKKCFGSLTTGHELYTAEYLASAAKKNFDIYKDTIFAVSKDRQWLEGKIVLEIGPGSHLAVPLLFISEGAQKVISVDRYKEVKFGNKETSIYENSMSRMSLSQKGKIAPLVKDLSLIKSAPVDLPQLSYFPDLPIEGDKILDVFSEGSFDLIVSFNTLEHIKDLDSAFSNMGRLLKKGGLLIHRIDSGTHYSICRYTKNRLSHFILSDSMYAMMFSNRDAPNRRLLDEYLKIAEAKKLRINSYYVDEVATGHEIEMTASFLSDRYAGLPVGGLSKTGFVIVAKKE